MKGTVGNNAIHRDPHHFFGNRSIFAQPLDHKIICNPNIYTMENRLKTLKNKRNAIGKRISNILSRKHNSVKTTNVSVGTNAEYPLIYKMRGQTTAAIDPMHKTDLVLWEGPLHTLRNLKTQPVLKISTSSGNGHTLRLIDILDLMQSKLTSSAGPNYGGPRPKIFENEAIGIQIGIDFKNKNPYF